MLFVTTVSMMNPNSYFLQSALELTSFSTINWPTETPALADVESISTAFHFLEPIAPASGDPSKFDPTLLNYLTVEVCEVGLNGCTLIKTFTSQGSEPIRITFTGGYGNFYIVNWDTKKSNLAGKNTYRVSVSAAGILLGSVDLTPAMYSSFGRTWPIKFLIEKDAELRSRLFNSIGKSCSQMASMLKHEFGMDPQAVRSFLSAEPPLCTQAEIDLAIEGVFQEVVLQPNTKISDAATGDALISFDTLTGQMMFITETPLLRNIRAGDVFVSEPTPAAPFGLLRKITGVRKSKGQVFLQTVQAKINEAVKFGKFHGAAELLPEDTSVETASVTKLPSVEKNEPIARAAETGDNFNFHRDIDVTIDLEGADGDVSGTGTVRIQGSIDFNAGWDMGFGVEDCFDEFPPICVDRVEAHVKVDQKSTVKVTGNFNGHLNKEETIDTIHFDPITFFIGPIPVVIVPKIDIIAGVTGNAHADFVFDAHTEAAFKAGLKWTDPDDGGEGWKPIHERTVPTGDGSGTLNVDLDVEGYAKGHAKLLLYGIAGPGIAASLGLRAEVHTGQSPLWRIKAHINGKVTFSVDIGGVIDLGNHEETVLDEQFEIKAAANQDPECFWTNDTIKPNITVPITLGPNGGGFFGYFNCVDPEGRTVNYTAKSSVDTDGNNGVIPLRYAFASGGPRTVTITATDGDGGVKTFDLHLDVVNTPPIIIIATATTTVQKGVQYFITAAAYDWEAQEYVTCLGPGGQINFSVTGPDVLQKNDDVFTCTAVVVFGEEGSRNIRVDAFDQNGGHSDRTVTVNVTAPPSNLPPTIDLNSFLITAAEGPDNPFFCPGGLNCEAPFGADLSLNTGRYKAPLTLSLQASDPNNEILTINWFCGDTPATVADGKITCPAPVVGDPFIVRATVSDGTTTVHSEVRHFFAAFGPR